MATYFHHHQNHHNAATEQAAAADNGLQTLILMNPNFQSYPGPHAPPSETSNFLFNAPTLYHAQPQLLGVPFQHYGSWAQVERGSPRAQQGLSLTLAAAEAEPDHLPVAETAADSGAGGDVANSIVRSPYSSYLKAAQELLEEVVNVGVDRVKTEFGKNKLGKSKGESPKADHSVAGDAAKPAEINPADKQELQMKKAKLITLLDEVEQRQKQYHHQMQAVVSSFEELAGPNSARTYTSLALKTISTQFRSLRAAITGQIRAANRALGEGEGEGGSFRLKLLDHQMRQQRAFHQLGMIQNNAWRPQRGLPEKAVSVLRAWLFEHFLHPYPKDCDKIMLAKQTGLSRSQVSNWFINARVRLWKPMIEEMYAEEVKEHQQQNGSEGNSSKQDHHHDEGGPANHNPIDDQVGNHNSSMIANSENPFALVENETQGSCIKKQRMNNEFLSTTTNNFPNTEMYNNNNNGCKDEADRNKYDGDMQGSNNGLIMGGLVSSYPIGEIGRFESQGHFPANFSGNGVSLTLGLPHCESLSIQGNNHQAFLHNNQETIDEFRGRLEMNQLSGFGGVKPPNSSQNAYAAHLLHDFVA